MRVVTSFSRWLAFGLLALGVSVTGTGCADTCGEAESLCVECEGGTPDADANCEATFGDANAEFCEQAIATYESNCAGRE